MLMNMANLATDIFFETKTFEPLTHLQQTSTKLEKSVKISVAFISRAQ